jgi:hypothetical protein
VDVPVYPPPRTRRFMMDWLNFDNSTAYSTQQHTED